MFGYMTEIDRVEILSSEDIEAEGLLDYSQLPVVANIYDRLMSRNRVVV